MTPNEEMRVAASDSGALNHDIPDPALPALQILLGAYEYAKALQRDPWDFAVEIQDLEFAGVGISEVRWLSYTGLVEHGREITLPEDLQRDFQRGGRLALNRKTCLVLSDLGVCAALRLKDGLGQPSRTGMRVVGGHQEQLKEKDWAAASTQLPQVPTWDGDRHELRWGDALVKQFKLASPGQETVLAVFEEENWPDRIDDPLPPNSRIDSQQRLDDTIRSLNRHQTKRLVRFSGDGTGQGICWEPVVDSQPF